MIEILEIDASETWPLRHKVMWPSKLIDFVILPNDEDGIHYGLFEKEKLVSVISLFINQNAKEAQFRKFATDLGFQRKGYGTELLLFLIKESKKLHVKKLTCSARISAIEFYKKLEMKVCSDVIIKNGKEYVLMELIFD